MAKRVRHSFKNYGETAHKWAAQDPECTYGHFSNMNFRNDTIYSYRWWPMAVIHGGMVLIRNWPYSNSTSKHLGWVRDAVSHMEQIYCYNPCDEKESMSHFIQDIKDSFNRFDKARIKTRVIKENTDEINEMIRYCTFKGITIPDEATTHRLDLIHDLNVIIEAEREKEEKRLAKIALLEEEAERRNKKIQEESGTLSDEERWILGKKSETKTWWKVQGSRLVEYTPYGYDTYRFSMTRLRINNGHVETSRHAYVPIESAARLWGLIRDRAYIHGEICGSYRVTSWNGTLKIGCHDIQKEEIHRFVVAEGWATEEEALAVLGV